MEKLPVEKVRWEIDQGIADVAAALGDPKDLAPFFRIPGLARSDAIEQELAARSLVVFSSDTVADYRHRRIKPADIVRRAMSRLEARGKGILLLHDIHPATIAALPELLKKLKEAGFHVVHLIPGAGDRIEIAGEPTALDQHDPTWPRPVAPPTDNRVELPAPDENAFAADYRPWHVVVLADGSTSAGYLALAAITQWAEPQTTSASSSEPELAAPSIPEYLDTRLFHDSARADKPPASGPAVSDNEARK